ncbi:tumor necrosis factor receptor superfamily member 6 [Danio rerio]|uniref:Tumor necrosis factor receptor superfamily member 6 n=1 Tax=Danio rerio TaxID=7955 RepID=A0ACD6B665_DANRE|nr:tumor necrosis factor receptor superfamily member 26 [Danio rerio]|eukprot:XP_690447.5 tumor necrosis factor receptor superfamily member 26 [Danio rerio]
MFVCKFGVFIVFVMPTLTYSWRLRRDASCEFGTYQHERNTCCLCPAGFKVSTHCTNTDKTECKQCEDGYYLNNNNNENQCRPCKICDANAKMKEIEKCSKSSNTVCGCEEGRFCDKDKDCNVCYPCDPCPNGVKEQCTETHNTVCHDAKDLTGTIAAAVVVSFILIAVAAFMIFIWKKKKFCFQVRQSTDKVQTEEALPLIDLSPHLPKIADVLCWKTVKEVARRSGMTAKDIEEQELNHPKDAREQTFGLLEAWSQRQGLDKAYRALITTLQDIGEKATADKIQNIVKASSQP